LSIKIFSRGKGTSAVAKAAYRAAELIKSEYSGEVHDYTRKGGVVNTGILLPDNAPTEYANRAILWNAVEMSERNKNAQLAREVVISLPVELTLEQNIALARDFAKRTFVDKGMCADVCVHDKNDGNPHAHIMLTLRPFNEDGTWAAKSKKEYILDKNGERIVLPSGEFKTRKINAVDWNEQTKADEWRKAWEEIQNAALAKYGHSARVDHRSYKRQGIDKIPTVKMGAAATQMEKRGVATERGNINREITDVNKEMRQIKARIKRVKDWLYAQPVTDPPTMISVMGHIADAKNLDTRWKKINNLKTQANVLMFLQQHEVYDMAQLVGMVGRLHENIYEVSNRIKAVERRLGTLTQHLAQYENYKQHKAIFQKYKQLEPKKRNAFFNKHSDKIQLYETASRYLKDVLNGRTEVPVNKWKAEHAKLTAEQYSLCEDYYRLKDKTRSVELLRKGAENMIRLEASVSQHKRAQDKEIG
jgi:hypothetical protein